MELHIPKSFAFFDEHTAARNAYLCMLRILPRSVGMSGKVGVSRRPLSSDMRLEDYDLAREWLACRGAPMKGALP